ncbi:MAG TPA: hypothetical protein VNT75_03180, partial [Symbiobacteriaceae bacterium]|nr:hypothetical protein [Symbiobacteriaceae bacterium]
MLSPRWIKALRDLARYKSRTFLVVASIAVGILAFGAIAGARAILARNLTDSFAATEPASFVLLTADFEQSLVERVSRVDGVALAEGRRRLRLRIRADGASAWQNIELYGLADFTGQTVSKVAAQSGPWPPAEGELLLERSAPDFLGLHPGDTAQVEGEGNLRVAGTAHDLQLFPTPLTKRGAGYVTLPTLARLGQPERFNQLLVVVAGDRMDIAQIQRLADRVTREVEAAGGVVFQRSIPEPMQHPMDSMVQTVLVILGVLGLMTLLLSGLLVVNTMAAALAGQIRQIG